MLLVSGPASKSSCGVNLKFWLQIHFFIELYQALGNMVIMYQEIQNHRLWKRFGKAIKFIHVILVEAFRMPWLIYGNIIYYSMNNLCQSQHPFLTYFMMMCLIFGYVTFFVYFMLLLLLCVFFVVRSRV